MPRNITEFDLFVSSPADVADERDCVGEAVDELNANWQRQLGLRLNVIRWENYGLPGFGEDAQDVLNQDLPEQLDAFVGILWSRIGTPTRRAESGTVEEFERTYKQWKTKPDTIRQMMYFKNADVPFEEIDTEQITSVRQFKSSLSNRGCLYQDFKSTDEFRRLIRNHLTQLAQKLASRHRTNDAQDTRATSQVAVTGAAVVAAGAANVSSDVLRPRKADVDDDEGLIDLVEKYQYEMSNVVGVANSLTESVETLGAQTKKSISDLNQLDLKQNPQRMKQAKRVVNGLARHLQSFAKRVGAEAPVMKGSFNEASAAFEGAIVVAPDFGEEGIRSIKGTAPNVERLIGTLDGTIVSIGGMRTSILRVPRTTTQFNRARRAAVNALDELLYTLDSAKRVIESSLRLLDALELPGRV